MKRTFLVLAVLLAIAFLAIVISQNVTDAQRPDRGDAPGRGMGPGGGMGRMIGPEALMRGMSFDRTWMYLSFEMNTTDEQLVKTRAAYLEAWKSLQEQGKAMQEEMRGNQGSQEREQMQAVFEKMRATAREIQDKLDASLQEILSQEQYDKLIEVRKEEQQRMREQMQRQRNTGGNRPQGRQGPPGTDR